MKPAVTLAETSSSQGTQLALIEHDGEFYLQSDGIQLQSSFAHNAAMELGRLACQPLRSARQPTVLVSGLGLGYVLRSVREALPQKRAHFLVAEPEQDLIEWHRQHLQELHPGQAEDARVEIRAQTLSAVLRKGYEFQALILDLEGGLPLEGACNREGVPHSSFLHRAHSSLKEGGLLALMCMADHRSFERKLRQAGFDVTREIVPTSHKGKQKQRSTIWLARKGSYQPRQSRPQR